jgi:bifunctional non-homologous end joining protein LigD
VKRPLDTYAAKRKFNKTSEPGPKVVTARQGPLLFIVQKHAARRMHYDFRLEVDGVLKSWAVPKGPSLQLGEKRLAVEVEDHPFDYASFEGRIPDKEYGAGHVVVWDCGVYSPDEDDQYLFADREQAQQQVREGLDKGKLSIFLRGMKLKGSFALVRTTTAKQWLLLKHEDRFATSDDLLSKSSSVLCGLTLDQLAARELPPQRLDATRLGPSGTVEAMPQELAPMLAETGDEVRSEPGWLYEPKLDGYRVLAFIEHAEVRLQSRGGIDLTPLFPEIVADLAGQATESMVLDGEIVVLGEDGRPSFNALQNRAQVKVTKDLAEVQRRTPAVLVCFDVLHFAGINLRGASYLERRRYLSQCLLPSRHLQLMHVSDDATKLYEVSLASGFEGIIGKRMDSPYQPGRRSAAWLKFKTVNTFEFVIGGYTKGKRGREALGALLLGYWQNNELHYVGHVGSGFDEQAVHDLQARLAGLIRKTSPFVTKPPLHRPTVWVAPQLVAEINFDSWSAGGYLRFPVFVRLRDDVPSTSVRSGPQEEGHRPKSRPKPTPADAIGAVLQQLEGSPTQLTLDVGGQRIRLTNLDRVYWPATGRHPAVAKRDLIRYLAAVSPYMLPHLCDRPLTMIRMPEGIDGERFFQKHWEQKLPEFVETVTVYSEHRADQHAYLLANNLPTLLWLAQVGTLEFHVWHSRAKVAPDSINKKSDYASSREAMEDSVLNFPDYLVFDIDPYIYSGKEAKGAEPELNKKGFAVGRRVAFWLRALLQQMSLDALVKTSGKTGLHVFVPIERTVTFDGARQICEMVGRHVMQQHPKEITMDWAVIKRTGKIFIDYNMNVRGKTLNVAYSPRGVPGAPVSMPLTWEELEAAEPLDFTMSNVLAKLEKTGDRWHDAFLNKYSLARAFGQQR